MKVGYARVSTVDQDYTIQEETLGAAGCEKVFVEKKSGTSRSGRSALQEAIEFVREGDSLVVTRIDRLARSMRDLQNLVHELQEKKVELKATEQPIDTSSAAGKCFLDMLGVFAEFETNLRKERQREGIEKAKKEGKYKGRKSVLTPEIVERIREGHQSGANKNRLAEELGISRATLFRAIREL